MTTAPDIRTPPSDSERGDSERGDSEPSDSERGDSEPSDSERGDADFMIFGGNDQGFLEYPQPHYAKMRAHRPVLCVEGAVQTTTRAALDTALRNAEVYSSGIEGAPLGNERPLIPLQIDPPDPRKYRKLLDPFFAPKQMAVLEPQISAQ